MATSKFFHKLQSENAQLKQRIAELEAELAKYSTPTSGVHTTFCQLCEMDWAHGACGDCTVTRKQLDHILRVEQELSECEAGREKQNDCAANCFQFHDNVAEITETIRQQTARECMNLAAARSPIVGYDIANAIKQKYGI